MVERLAAHAVGEPPPIQIQDLGYRWCSCGRNGRLYFNWRLLGRIMPDYPQRRDRLAQMGGEL